MALNIYVEGIEDLRFLSALLKVEFNIKVDPDGKFPIGSIINVNGKDNLKGEYSRLKRNDGNKNIVIFDADIGDSKGLNYAGYKLKKEYLESEKEREKLHFDLFLFPDNGSDGTLESLMKSCIKKDFEPVKKCLEGFAECLNK